MLERFGTPQECSRRRLVFAWALGALCFTMLIWGQGLAGYLG